MDARNVELVSQQVRDLLSQFFRTNRVFHTPTLPKCSAGLCPVLHCTSLRGPKNVVSFRVDTPATGVVDGFICKACKRRVERATAVSLPVEINLH